MAHIKPDGTIHYDQITRPVEVQANYLASRRDGFGVDDGISIYTGLMPWNWDWKYWKTEKWWKVWKVWGNPGVSHTSVGYWLDGELWFFSSTSRKELGGKNGTRWIPGAMLLRNPERWRLQEKKFRCGVTRDTDGYLVYDLRYGMKKDLIRRIARANSLIGLGYDFYGVGADFVNPIRVFFKRQLIKVIHKLKKIYCSKAVHAVQTGMLCVFSPRRKWKWAKKNGYKAIENTWNYLNKE